MKYSKALVATSIIAGWAPLSFNLTSCGNIVADSIGDKISQEVGGTVSITRAMRQQAKENFIAALESLQKSANDGPFQQITSKRTHIYFKPANEHSPVSPSGEAQVMVQRPGKSNFELAENSTIQLIHKASGQVKTIDEIKHELLPKLKAYQKTENTVDSPEIE